MKCLLLIASVLGTASATALLQTPASTSLLPAFYNGGLYNYGYGPYATGYAYGYNNLPAWSAGYSFSTVGATPYYAAAPYAPAAALPYAAAPVAVAAPAAPAVVAAPAPAAVAAYAPAYYSGYVSAEGSQAQYRSQDSAGNYAFGYAGGPSSRQEVRTPDGIVQGSFSYVDANNLVQTRSYVADALGFRVAGSDIPVAAAPAPAPVAVAAAPAPAVVIKSAPLAIAPAPAAPVVAVVNEGPAHIPVEGIDVPYKTPEVKQAEAAHFAAHAEALARSKREASPSGKLRSWPVASPVKGRSSYPIKSVVVPAPRRPALKAAKRWRRESDPSKGKLWLKKGPVAPRAHGWRPAPKKIVLVKGKKW